MQPVKKDISESEQYKYYCYMLYLMLPWLKEFQQEQNAEKEIEATIRGTNLISMSFLSTLSEYALILSELLIFL
jgi:hypothetical protein